MTLRQTAMCHHQSTRHCMCYLPSNPLSTTTNSRTTTERHRTECSVFKLLPTTRELTQPHWTCNQNDHTNASQITAMVANSTRIRQHSLDELRTTTSDTHSYYTTIPLLDAVAKNEKYPIYKFLFHLLCRVLLISAYFYFV